MPRLALLVAVLLFLCPVGCKVTDKAIDTAKTAAAGNDRYTTLAAKALAGEASMATDGVAAISRQDLAETPQSVKVLLSRLLESLATNRFAWHSVLFQLDEGQDPATLGLEPVELPGDANDDLLEDD